MYVKLRRAPERAIERLERVVADAGDDQLRRLAINEFLWHECPLLSAARKAHADGALGDLYGLLDEQNASWRNMLAAMQRLRGDDQVRMKSLRARAALIRGLAARVSERRLKELLNSLIQAAICQGFKRIDSKIDLADGPWRKGGDDAARRVLRVATMRGLNETLFPKLFLELAKDHGWWHPGLHMAIDAVGWIYGVGIGSKPDVTTRILVVDKNSGNGCVLGLALEKRAIGAGAMFPHPAVGSSLRVDEAWQGSLQDAWHAALGTLREDERDFDIRWWIQWRSPAPALHLRDTSASLAFACGLRAIHREEPLDDNVAATAEIDSRGKLKPIGFLAEKMAAPEFRVNQLLRNRIDEVVVSGDQQGLFGETDQGEDGKIWYDKRTLLVKRVADFDEAYDRLSRFAGITRAVKRSLAQRAAAILRDERPYVEPEIEIKVVDPAEGRSRWVKLADSQRRSLLRRGHYGRIHVTEAGEHSPDLQITAARSSCVLAESGLGKTLFLVWLQRAIARSRGPMVPVRLGAGPGGLPLLSAIDWGTTDEKLLAIRDCALAGCLPRQKQYSIDDVNAWFLRLVREGRIVWLLDAIDQFIDPELEKISNLDAFLQSEQIRRCPVIVTGRPDSNDLVDVSLSGRTWSQLRISEFDDERIRIYLETYAGQLLPEPRDNFETRDRKAGWHDLLRIPITLKLMKGLAATHTGLADHRNRCSVYGQALGAYITRGLKKAAKTIPNPLRHSESDLASMLESTAEQTIFQERPNFTGHLSGSAYTKWHEWFAGKYGPDAFSRLVCVNLFSIESTPTVSETGTASSSIRWRHRSFCEYYAARAFLNFPAEHRRELCRRFAVSDDWRWLFRFALSHAALSGMDAELLQIAECLVGSGNPFRVSETLYYDKLNLAATKSSELSERGKEVEQTIRWLTHRDLSEDAEIAEFPIRPAVRALREPILASLERPFRDSRYVVPACELLGGWRVEELNPHDPSDLVLRLEEWFASDRESLSEKELATLGDFTKQFVPVSAQCYDATGSDSRTREQWNAAGIPDPKQIAIPEMEFAHIPTTNAVFEMFDLRHAQYRDRYSNRDDHPAIYVNWYMANAFCAWLTTIDLDRKWFYRLPKEWEWACIREYRFSTSLIQSEREETSVRPRIWEWCFTPDPGDPSAKVVLGGTWAGSKAEQRLTDLGSAQPNFRHRKIGFRVVRTQLGPLDEVVTSRC